MSNCVIMPYRYIPSAASHCASNINYTRKHSWVAGQTSLLSFHSVTSLGWVMTTGAATEGVTPLFFSKIWRPFCSSLSLSLSLFIAFSRVSPLPLEGVTPHLFLPVRPRFSTILCKFTHKIVFLRVSTPGGCHPELSAPCPRLVTPLFHFTMVNCYIILKPNLSLKSSKWKCRPGK